MKFSLSSFLLSSILLLIVTSPYGCITDRGESPDLAIDSSATHKPRSDTAWIDAIKRRKSHLIHLGFIPDSQLPIDLSKQSYRNLSRLIRLTVEGEFDLEGVPKSNPQLLDGLKQAPAPAYQRKSTHLEVAIENAITSVDSKSYYLVKCTSQADLSTLSKSAFEHIHVILKNTFPKSCKIISKPWAFTSLLRLRHHVATQMYQVFSKYKSRLNARFVDSLENTEGMLQSLINIGGEHTRIFAPKISGSPLGFAMFVYAATSITGRNLTFPSTEEYRTALLQYIVQEVDRLNTLDLDFADDTILSPYEHMIDKSPFSISTAEEQSLVERLELIRLHLREQPEVDTSIERKTVVSDFLQFFRRHSDQ